MKPIAIFRFSPTEGPGYFATFLDEQRLPWQLFRIDSGDALPSDLAPFSGICLMGGPMSANDPLPWIGPVQDRIREAVDRDIPALGHCLGGQLMAKALGGSVTINPIKEIGWHDVDLCDDPCARHWFGRPAALPVFQWHGDTFSLPPRATRLARSAHCENQIFVLGKHLAMQCHIEMTTALVQSWCANGQREIAESKSPAVQSVDEILCDLDERVRALNELARLVYRRWREGLRPDAAASGL